MGRHANPDIRRAFQEFQEEDTPTKCNKVRCLHCGFVRAKNTTRQIEHLQQCQQYLESADAQAHISETPVDGAQVDADLAASQARAVLNGHAPNPNLQVHRRGPNQNKRQRESAMATSAPRQFSGANGALTTSLTGYLMNSHRDVFERAVQRPFLQHAGCGTLATAPLMQWLAQDANYTRSYIQFIGSLISKVRLPQTQNSQAHPSYRALDLLITAINNVRREMGFLENMATKYGVTMVEEPPTIATKAFMDLFASCGSSTTSLLEGFVVMWATETTFHKSWECASKFSQTSHFSTDPHVAVLQQAVIPNRTAQHVAKFNDCCRVLVDELANGAIANGKEEMERCELAFKQVCWLQERFWPAVDGMGEQDDGGRHSQAGTNGLDGGYGEHLNGINEASAVVS